MPSPFEKPLPPPKQVYLDNDRPCPAGWIPAKSAEACIAILAQGNVDAISLDHDLGGKKTGEDVVAWMISHKIWPKKISLHSTNPKGRAAMRKMILDNAPGSTKLA